MLMYTGRPLLGAMRYVLMIYPAFLVWGAYAARWDRKQFGFLSRVARHPEPGMAVGIPELVAGFVNP